MIRASFVGNLGRNAEVKQVGDTTVTKFSVPSSSGYGDKKKTTWVECDLWGSRGEKIASYLIKGQQVLVYGEIELHTYTANDGTNKASLRCRVNELEFVGKKPEGGSQTNQGSSQAAGDGKDFDEEIPF